MNELERINAFIAENTVNLEDDEGTGYEKGYQDALSDIRAVRDGQEPTQRGKDVPA